MILASVVYVSPRFRNPVISPFLIPIRQVFSNRRPAKPSAPAGMVSPLPTSAPILSNPAHERQFTAEGAQQPLVGRPERHPEQLGQRDVLRVVDCRQIVLVRQYQRAVVESRRRLKADGKIGRAS